MGKMNKLLDFLTFIPWLRNAFIFNGSNRVGLWWHHNLLSASSLFILIFIYLLGCNGS